MPEIAGDHIDRLCTVEMRPQGYPRGLATVVYDLVHQKQGKPLTYLAAQGLVERVGPGDYVLIDTGAGTSS